MQDHNGGGGGGGLYLLLYRLHIDMDIDRKINRLILSSLSNSVLKSWYRFAHI